MLESTVGLFETAHLRSRGLEFIPLADNGFDTIVQLGGHLIEGFGQAGHFFRVRRCQAVAEIAVGEMPGA